MGTAAWWIGPQVVHIALFDTQRSEPYLIMDFAQPAQDNAAAVLDSRYQQPLSGLIASEGGVKLGGYSLVQLLEGTRADEWSHLNNFHLSRAQDLAQIMTSSPYRLVTRSDQIKSFTLGQYFAKPIRWRAGLVVWLVQASSEQNADPLAPVIATLETAQGRLVWDKIPHIYHQDNHWDRLLVMDFPSAELALAWIRQPDVATARVIASAKARRSMVAVYASVDDNSG